jgi:hypothetical protein
MTYRNGWRDMRDAERCWNCRHEWRPSRDDDMRCAYCDAHVCDEPPEPDPDDARDARLDRDQEPYGRDSDIWGFDE